MPPFGVHTEYNFPPVTFLSQDLPNIPNPVDLPHHPPQFSDTTLVPLEPPVVPLYSAPDTPLKIKVPPLNTSMPPITRNGSRRTTSNVTDPGHDHHENDGVYVSHRGRITNQRSYLEASDDDPMTSQDIDADADGDDAFDGDKGDSSDADARPARQQSGRLNRLRGVRGVIQSDEDGETHVAGNTRYNTRSQSKSMLPAPNGSASSRLRRQPTKRRQTTGRGGRLKKRQGTYPVEDEEGYVDEPSNGSSDGEGSLDDALPTSPDGDADADGEAEFEGEGEQEQEPDGRPYALRRRTKINYAIPPPLEEMRPPPKNRGVGGRNQRSGGHGGGRGKGPGWSATGAELSRWMGGDDSDSDFPTRTPRKPFGGVGGVGGMFAGNAATGGFLPSDLAAAAGTPSNLGKVGDAVLADADPLGVNQNVTFDEVGGLDDHINSLKEMTLLPLLYPEVFQRLNLTPPRGVLFHGPPGTGKTLLARALAANCRSNGKSISFFMRKGADCLSKWVGEAERQLRLLFEEARNQQPSIIFFDEIDGLAPVRSSKQDQIHASIVSTLLALMDGMDGRGQVVVIGATNRPDAIDPALRRPGRFDREFFFPLPSLSARERILQIMTRNWAGWEGEKGEANAKGLAKLTKGYGGADLRALCTEAALNAVQRRYPQIYKSNERLLLEPETISVEMRDFMVSVKKLVPSSARSASSVASPLPIQLVPLLQDSLEKVKIVIGKVLPVSKKRTALEEAEWEDEGNEGALERELMMQSMETLRVYRPRIILYGPAGMGQDHVAAAALHHLEGYHVQSLDLGSLLSDSTRTPEASIVQLFIEAKRHQPSVVYIPSLIGWCAAVSETSRTTVRAMLDTLSSTDPVLLLAVVDGPLSSIPRDVRAWFGPTRDNRVELPRPHADQREAFFGGLLQDIGRPPNQFPDGIKRKKRVLEELPIAPPLEPRQPTAAELAVQEENDQRVLTLLRYRLGPILTELKRKFKRFTKRAMEEYNYDFDAIPQVQVVPTTVEAQTLPDGIEVVDKEDTNQAVEQPINGHQTQDTMQLGPEPPLFDMDLERMHVELYKSRYLTPDDFLDDIRKIVHNADVRVAEDPERLFRAQAMLTAAEVSIQDFDPQFRLECQRTAVRERKRREEHRKNKAKGKAVEPPIQNGVGQTYAPGTRRSARHNGLEPELKITDPLLLERKLKRQRSNEAAATPIETESGEPAAKRTRVEDDDDHDPMDIIRQPLSPHPVAVHFEDDEFNQPPSSSPLPNGIELSQSEPTPKRGLDRVSPSLSPSSDTRPVLPPPSDPDDNPFTKETISVESSLPLTEPPSSSAPFDDHLLESRDTEPGSQHPMEVSESEAVVPEQAVERPMEIERLPTPLPEFHLDQGNLSSLKDYLISSTEFLTVEQLEQLRAACLGCVWRHRTDWDRTPLMKEVHDLAKEYIEEVALDDLDYPASPEHHRY